MVLTNASGIDTRAARLMLGTDDGRALFNATACDLIDLGRDEFLARWNAGECADADAPGNSDVMFLAMLAARDE